MYPSAIEKAGAILESIVKNHPFIEVNKRTGLLYISLALIGCSNAIHESRKSIKEKLPELSLDSLQPNLIEPEILGTFTVNESANISIILARECDECDANSNLYIIFSYDSTNKVYGPYSQAGEEYYYEDNSLIYQGRVFYGEVLPNIFGLIWYQNELNENAKWIKSVYLFEITEDKINEREVSSELKKTLEQVAARVAFELEGESRTSEP